MPKNYWPIQPIYRLDEYWKIGTDLRHTSYGSYKNLELYFTFSFDCILCIIDGFIFIRLENCCSAVNFG